MCAWHSKFRKNLQTSGQSPYCFHTGKKVNKQLLVCCWLWHCENLNHPSTLGTSECESSRRWFDYHFSGIALSCSRKAKKEMAESTFRRKINFAMSLMCWCLLIHRKRFLLYLHPAIWSRHMMLFTPISGSGEIVNKVVRRIREIAHIEVGSSDNPSRTSIFVPQYISRISLATCYIESRRCGNVAFRD